MISILKRRDQLTIEEALKLKGNEFSEKCIFDVYYLPFKDSKICVKTVAIV